MRAPEDGSSPEFTTNQKGAIAETAIAHQATKLGIDVYRPYSEGGRYDLIFDLGTRLLRVQCKWAVRSGGVVSVRLHSCRRGPGGTLLRRSYSETEIDAVAGYCAELDECYVLPSSLIAGKRQVYLRLAPSKNNQALRINWADEYRLGAIAQ